MVKDIVAVLTIVCLTALVITIVATSTIGLVDGVGFPPENKSEAVPSRVEPIQLKVHPVNRTVYCKNECGTSTYIYASTKPEREWVCYACHTLSNQEEEDYTGGRIKQQKD